MSHVNAVSFTILVVTFAVVTLVGFAAARWRRAEDVLHLNEWGLGGRGFGTFITWFLLGGDLYTAYTFIAVPALVYGTGSAGFFTLSYTIMVYPIVFVFLPRLWSVARVHGYITPADFVRGRYGSRGLSLAVAFTGILAVMPYIALQLVGIQSVLTVMGVGGSSTTGFLHDLPLIIAFIILAGYTFVSGLRGPALIAFIKDTLIYVMIIVAIIYIPIRVGGWGHIFSVADTHLKSTNPKTGKPFGSLIEEPAGMWAYSTLALGSALALFMYPHNITGVFAAKRRNVIRRNVAALPAYSLVLGLIALLGYMALAAPGVPAEVKAHGSNAQLAVPLLFQRIFPSWFAGIGFSAIVIGALVPAAIMSIAAANLFTRNIWKEYFRPQASDAEQTRVSQTASLLVKLGALLFVLLVKTTYAIQLQLLGGVWIVQTFPAIVAGLYTRWFHRWALFIGWAVAMVFGTIAAYRQPAPGEPGTHFGASTDTLPVINHTIYIGLTGLVINLVISVVLTLVFRAIKLPGGSDETRPEHYVADPEPATAEKVPVAAGAADAG
ncbi:MAG: monocarboxylate uptake permease MctP, partial [Streptosporangiaceae bacterium]